MIQFNGEFTAEVGRDSSSTVERLDVPPSGVIATVLSFFVVGLAALQSEVQSKTHPMLVVQQILRFF